MHVFGPEGVYTAAPDAKYTLPRAYLETYLAVAGLLNLERFVLVQPSFYGQDNSCLIHSMERLAKGGRQCRGVVFLPERANADQIEDFHEHGIRGIRLDFFKAAANHMTLAEIREMLRSAAEVAKSAGWHVELYSPGRVTFDLLDVLPSLGVDFSISHMGYMTREERLTDEDFRRFLEMVKSEHCWVKLTGPYRVAKDDELERPGWMARELIAAAPERMLWGTDWPHIRHYTVETGELLNRLAEWCPDEAVREKILVANPARLYQF